jgi:hypothetical protein
MAFLRLEHPQIEPANLRVPDLEDVPSGVSEASEAQRRSLEDAVPLGS